MNFKKKILAIIILPLVGLLGFVGLNPKGTVFSQTSGNATLTLSPSSGSYTHPGGTINVQLILNTPEPAVTAVARIVFNPSQVSYVGRTFNSSFDFSNTDVGTNYVEITFGRGSPFMNGSVNVATLTFNTLTTGSTVLSFGSSSSVIPISNPDGNIWNGNTNGGTYTISTVPAPAPTPAPSPSPQPSAPSNSTGSSASTTPRSTTRTQTPGATQPTVSQQAEDTSTSAQQANPDEPVAETGATYDQGLYPVSIKVKDESGNNLSGAQVTLGDKSATTDENGNANFDSVPAGNYQVTITANGQVLSQSVDVRGDLADGQLQEFEVAFEKDSNLVWYLSGGAALLALIGAGVFAWSKGAFKGLGSFGSGSNALGTGGAGVDPDLKASYSSSDPFTKPVSNPLLEPPPPPEAGSVFQPQNQDTKPSEPTNQSSKEQ